MRVRFVALVCLAGLFCLPVFANETRGSEASGESSFRGGPSHLGVYSSSPLRQLAGVAWRSPTAGPVHSSPTVSEGRVLVGSGDGNLYALDEKSGREIWRFSDRRSGRLEPGGLGGSGVLREPRPEPLCPGRAFGKGEVAVRHGRRRSLLLGL